ncbi:hypothetical protein FRC12_012149 [Ceratobasidium sp. 428]|nr:hypothetical protein FRC12_012149 [Ceratobasidium sp. 428]
MKIHAVIAILCLCSSRAFGSDASSRPRGGSFLGMPVLKTGLVILATLFVQAVYDECCAPSQALVNPTAWEQDVRMFNYSQKYSDDEVDEWCGMTELDGYVSYKHKEYRAQYVYTRDERDPLAQCAKTPAVINDVGYKRPFKCVYSRCTADIIFGIWYVETQQYTPRWGPFTDEGCVLCGQKVSSNLDVPGLSSHHTMYTADGFHPEGFGLLK